MADEPDRNNPLSPYWLSDTPTVPGNGRAWIALILVATFLFGTILWVVWLLVRLLG